MKKVSILLAGIAFTSSVAFAGGYGMTTPIKLAPTPIAIEATTTPVVRVTRQAAPATPRVSYCRDRRSSRWFECDTVSELEPTRRTARSILTERFSDSQRPTLQNRATRGQDLEREFDRQAAARNKLLRYRNAFGQ